MYKSIYSLLRASFGNLENVLQMDGLMFDSLAGTAMLYVFLCSVILILMTLLVAMFNYTFTKIAERSGMTWRCMRAEAVIQYIHAPVLPVPLSFLSDSVLTFRALIARLCGDGEEYQSLRYQINCDEVSVATRRETREAMRAASAAETLYTREKPVPREELVTGVTGFSEMVHDLLEHYQLKMTSEEEKRPANTSDVTQLRNMIQELQEKVQYFSEECLAGLGKRKLRP